MDDLDTRAARAAERLSELGTERGLTGEQIRNEIAQVFKSFSTDEIGQLGIV